MQVDPRKISDQHPNTLKDHMMEKQLRSLITKNIYCANKKT